MKILKKIFLWSFFLSNLFLLKETKSQEVPDCPLCPKGTTYCEYSCQVLFRSELYKRYTFAGLPEQNITQLRKTCLQDRTSESKFIISCAPCKKEDWCPVPEMYPWKNILKEWGSPVDENGESLASKEFRNLRITALFSNIIYDLPSFNASEKFVPFGNKIELPIEVSSLTNFGAVIKYSMPSIFKWEGDGKRATKMLVVFRGTENFKNFVDNIKSELVDFGCEGCKVHKKWLENYLSIKESLKKILDGFITQMPNEVYPEIIFTGHSYGGALATLAAFDFKKILNHTSVSLYTFGSPRVGNSKFVENYPLPSLMRVTNQNDLVTDLPPKAFGYQHIYPEVHFNNGPEDVFHYSWPWDTNYLPVDSDFLDYNSGRWNILDHSMSNYLQYGDKREDPQFMEFMNEVLAKAGLGSLNDLKKNKTLLRGEKSIE